ncbi:hypothetical protein [Novosphingobium beihaiensis]|uniref:Uncharacterized protein n=1 Tax=Novosphingobium beihaiensis TaxID=2930389 RepID=A0ABT0BWE1_9SPHN|nr:hypothetical protein [Novosphingobium beihaiensis]MCJ2189213.1 hypothetical protein [Novosphingobium beihaiensis]
MTTTSYTAYSLNSYASTPIGMAGRITDDGSTITPLPNMKVYTGTGAGDPQVEGFADTGNNLRIAATRYTGSGGPGVDIYNAETGTSVAADRTWANVTNLYGLVKVGSFLYALDFDNARLVEINPATYLETGKIFNFSTDPTTSGLYTSGTDFVHGQAIIEIGGVLFGLFTITNSSWTTYKNSVLVRFTIGSSSITVGSTAYNNNIEKNAFQMAVQGSDLYIASIGGYQSAGAPNTNSALQKIAYGTSNLTTATVNTVFGYSAAYPYEVRDISFNGTTAYVLVGAYDSSYVMKGKLLQTTTAFSNFTAISDFSTGAPGYFWAAQYIDNNRILFAKGNPILYYNAASPATPVATLTISSGSLMAAPNISYDSLNDVSYVGAKTTTPLRVRGYRSPAQVSHSPRGVAARAILKGRPDLLPEELEELEA